MTAPLFVIGFSTLKGGDTFIGIKRLKERQFLNYDKQLNRRTENHTHLTKGD